MLIVCIKCIIINLGNNNFLAHLSLRLIGELTGRPLSFVCVWVCVCLVNIFKQFSSETTGLIEAKFHVEPPWDGRTKICSNRHGHMTKLAAMPIYGKNFKKSSSPEPKGR